MLLRDLYESAPADQVKGTEKAKTVKPRPFAGNQPHPFQGRLVGGESKEDPRPEDNFGPDDIKKLERTQDINDARKMAIELISMASKRSMKPAKVEWFKRAVNSKKNVLDIVKLMYDLLLSGEGNKVIGSRHSMDPNSYRKAFGEDANPTDKVTMDIPLFIRMMEYAREDAKTDMDLHNVTERAIALMKQHDQLSMNNYDSLVSGEIEEDFEYNNPNLSPEQQDKVNKLIQQKLKNKPVDVDKLVKDPRPYKDKLPQGNPTAPMPVYDKNVPSRMPTTNVKPKQYVAASNDNEQTDEDWLDKVYAAGRNFADTASLGTYKYARAGADYAVKNAMNQLGLDDEGTTYQKELDQEIEKLDKDYKNEPAASLAGMAGAMAVPVAGEYGAALKGAQGLAGQALDTYSKATKIYPLAKAALGFKEDNVDENKLTYKDSLETWVKRFKEKYPNKDSVTIKKMAAAAKYRAVQDKKIEEEKKGLYYYVNKRKKAGTSRPKDHPKAPSAQDWKNAAKTAKDK